MQWKTDACSRCTGTGRIGIGARLPCLRCGGAGHERAVVWIRGYWVDLRAYERHDAVWRLRVVGSKRVQVARVNLRWFNLGDLWLGRSREAWPDYAAARLAGELVRQELSSRLRK